MSIIKRDYGSEFLLEVAKGNVPGHSVNTIRGRNSDIDTADAPVDLISGGGEYAGFNAIAAQPLDLVSDDANDALAGSGARTVLLIGLDATFAQITETVDLDGTNTVTSTLSFIRLNIAVVLGVGTSSRNEGTITIAQETSAIVMGIIGKDINTTLGEGSTLNAIFTVPLNRTLYFTRFFVSLNDATNTHANMTINIRNFGESWVSGFPYGIAQSGGNGQLQANFSPIPQKADIKVTITKVSSNGSDISAVFSSVLVDNSISKAF